MSETTNNIDTSSVIPFRYLLIQRMKAMFQSITPANGCTYDLSGTNSVIANQFSEIGDDIINSLPQSSTKALIVFNEIITNVDEDSVLRQPKSAPVTVSNISFVIQGLIPTDTSNSDPMLSGYQLMADMRTIFQRQKISLTPGSLPNPMGLGDPNKFNGNCVLDISLLSTSVSPLEEMTSMIAFWATAIVQIGESPSPYVSVLS